MRITAPYFRATGDEFLVWGSFPAWYAESRLNPERLPRVLSHLALALLKSGFIPLGSFGRWAAKPAPTPQTSNILATRLVRTGSKVGPTGTTPHEFQRALRRATDRVLDEMAGRGKHRFSYFGIKS